MKLIYLKKGDEEISSAFYKLPNGDPEAECPCCGEVWGYIETQLFDDVWKHMFRHRHFEGEKKYLQIPGSAGWEPKKGNYHLRPHQGGNV